MKTIAQRRKAFMDFLTKSLDLLEGGNVNSTKYKKKFNAMSDEEFDKYIIEFFENDKKQIYVEFIEFERDLKMKNIKACAEFMGVPLYEYVALPDNTGDPNNVVVTPQPVPVGYAHYKRMQQSLIKKNSMSIHIKKRNSKTGQVVGEDKVTSNSDVETYALMTLGAENAQREFMGPRADDSHMKGQMLKNISNNGFVKLEDLDSEPENKVALNTLNMYFVLQGFCTNLVGPLYILPKPKPRRTK